MFCDFAGETAEWQTRQVELWLRFVTEQQLGGNLLLHARDKILRRFEIEWHYNRAAQQAAVKRSDPFGTVLTPEQDAIAGADLTRFKFTCKLKRARSETRVGPA